MSCDLAIDESTDLGSCRSTLLQEYGLIVREARMQWNTRRADSACHRSQSAGGNHKRLQTCRRELGDHLRRTRYDRVADSLRNRPVDHSPYVGVACVLLLIWLIIAVRKIDCTPGVRHPAAPR